MIPGITASRIRQSSPAEGDPFWGDVRALLHFDGADESTVMLDEKGKIWTASGRAKLDAAQAKFGSSSLYLNGVTDYLRTPYVSGDFNPANDHTAEAWINLEVSKRHTLYNFSAGLGSKDGHYCAILADGRMQVVYGTNVGFNIVVSTNSVPVGAWTHVAVSKHASEVRIHIDGVLGVTYTLSGAAAPNVAAPMVGRDDTSTDRFFKGWIDDFRYTDGVARYTANFTRPVAPFPNS